MLSGHAKSYELPRWLGRLKLTRGRVLVASLCLLLIGVDDVHLLQERSSLLADASHEITALTASLAGLANSATHTTAAMLGSMAAELTESQWPDPPALAQAERILVQRQPILTWSGFSAIYNEHGQLLFSSGPASAPDSIADLPIFTEQNSQPSERVRTGAPLQLQSTHQWVVPLTRTLNRADGSFVGIVMIAIDIDHLLNDYAPFILPQTGVLGAFGADGASLLHLPSQHPFGLMLVPKTASASTAPEGVVMQTSTVDGVTRLISYRRVFDGNVVLQIGRDQASVLAAWRRSAVLQLVGLAILVTLTIWLVFVLESLSRRRRAVELRAARRSAKRMMRAHHGSDILLEFDKDLICRSVEPKLFEMCGYRPEDMVGTQMLDALQPPDRAAIALAFEAAIKGEARPALTTRLYHRDGTSLWMELVIRQIENNGDDVVIFAVMCDVTAQRKAEGREAAALADLQNAYSTLLRAQRIAQEGHWRLDGRTKAMVWSQEVSRIFGFGEARPHTTLASDFQEFTSGLPASEPVTLETMFARIHADEREKIASAMRGALADGGVFQSDFRVVQPDGSVRYVSCFGGPDHDADGEPAGLIGTVQDVTERTTQEHEQHHENKIRTIGRLASGVAHDFNNLLQSVTSCLELIGDQLAQNGLTCDYVRIALEAAERGSYLTHHLLSYARKQILKPKRVLPEAMMRDMQVLLERTLGPHIKVVTEIVGQIPAIEVDPTHLQTALLNLGINSGHAMANGGTLTLQAAMEDGPNPTVILAVTDTGIGMDAATILQSTEPFFTTKGVKGTGLGLSMVNGFAIQSGGEMRISSRPGEGTRIEIRLPAVLARELAAPAAQNRAAATAGHRILLVEDASDVRITTSAFLVARSLQTIALPSGEEALDRLSNGEYFDVMITDYAMPGIDGAETIRRARLLQPGLPAIIITGYADLEDAKELPQEVQVLRKPFHRLDLLDAVMRAMTHHTVASLATQADGADQTQAL